MMKEEEKKVELKGKEGIEDLKIIDRMVKEGGMKVMKKDEGEKDLEDGKVGF